MFKLEITANDITEQELARILHKIANVLVKRAEGAVRDLNGNIVGEWKWTEK